MGTGPMKFNIPAGLAGLKKHFVMTDPVVVGNDGKYFQVCHWERFEGQLLDLSFVSTVYILEQQALNNYCLLCQTSLNWFMAALVEQHAPYTRF